MSSMGRHIPSEQVVRSVTTSEHQSSQTEAGCWQPPLAPSSDPATRIGESKNNCQNKPTNKRTATFEQTPKNMHLANMLLII